MESGVLRGVRRVTSAGKALRLRPGVGNYGVDLSYIDPGMIDAAAIHFRAKIQIGRPAASPSPFSRQQRF